MIKILPQIVGTFLAIGCTFIAAYMIYIVSTQTSIDEKIQNEGALISSIFEDYPKRRNPFWAGDILLMKYEDIYPDKERIALLNKIGLDLITASLGTYSGDGESITQRLSSYANDGLPYKGRIFFYLIHEYIEKSLIHDPDPSRVRSFGEDARRNGIVEERSQLFPYGPFGLQSWLELFRKIRGPYEMLYRMREEFIDDLNEYLEKLQDGSHKEWLKGFKYDELIHRTNETFSKTEDHVKRIESLLRLKKYHTMEERIPHRWWILMLGSFSFFFGVLIPLVLLGLEVHSAPKMVNFMFLVLAFFPLFCAAHYFVSDIQSIRKREFTIEYILPLKFQLVAYEKDADNYASFNYELVNVLLDGKKKFDIPRRFSKLLLSYRDTVRVSNNQSTEIAGEILEEIDNNSVLLNHKISPATGGTVINLFSLFDDRVRDIRFEKNRNYHFTAQQRNLIKPDIGIKTSGEEEELEILTAEIVGVFTRFSAKSKVKECMSKREHLSRIRRELIEYIERNYG